MLREPDELGDLDEKTWQVITDNAYQRFADELAASNRSGRTSIPDPEAAAAVAIGSLSYAATLQALTGRIARQHRRRPLLRGVGQPNGQRPRAVHEPQKPLNTNIFQE